MPSKVGYSAVSKSVNTVQASEDRGGKITTQTATTVAPYRDISWTTSMQQSQFETSVHRSNGASRFKGRGSHLRYSQKMTKSSSTPRYVSWMNVNPYEEFLGHAPDTSGLTSGGQYFPSTYVGVVQSQDDMDCEPKEQNISRIDSGIGFEDNMISEFRGSMTQADYYSEYPGDSTYNTDTERLQGSRRTSPLMSVANKRRSTQNLEDLGHNKRRNIRTVWIDDRGEASGDDDAWSRPLGESVEGETKLFACPFYRRSPIRHRDCVNRKLTRIRDVKQHIQRRHVGGAFYCPTCFKSHASLHTRDEHIRSRRCEPRLPPVLDSLESNSREAQELFKYRANRAFSAEQQWHQIWDLLFKDGSKARSAYLGTEIEETVGIIRNFWEQESLQIDENYLASVGVRVQPNTDTRALVMGLFDKIQRQFEQKTGALGSVEVFQNEIYNDQSDELTSRSLTAECSPTSPLFGAGPSAVGVDLYDTHSDISFPSPRESTFLQDQAIHNPSGSPVMQQPVPFFDSTSVLPYTYQVSEWVPSTDFGFQLPLELSS
ncbi:hypothetical protein HJFPF1_11676 [Paramyrothecium foliicola]|nr:hypothetical protein HJFPF1_11676 [Paramyrothecium foliicola]